MGSEDGREFAYRWLVDECAMIVMGLTVTGLQIQEIGKSVSLKLTISEVHWMPNFRCSKVSVTGAFLAVKTLLKNPPKISTHYSTQGTGLSERN